MTIKNPLTQEILQWLPLDHIHRCHNVFHLFYLKPMLFQQGANALFGINPRMRPSLMQWPRQPTEKWHAIPWQYS